MVGDFVFQTRWQADGKFDDERLRARHVAAYTLPFVFVGAAYTTSVWRVAAGLIFLVGAHYLTDSRRFRSTLGDVLVWHLWRKGRTIEGREGKKLRLLPNPWLTLPLAIDQTLHVVQLAVLGSVFWS
jgi:hypothetical protein